MLTNASTNAASDAMRSVAALGDDERFWRINRLEALWNGQHYDGRPSFWNASVPLRERAPAVQSRLPRTAGLRLAHMVAGAGAFPSVHVASQGYRLTLTADEVARVQALVDEIVECARVATRFRAYLVEGLKTGTAVALQMLRDGRPSVQILPAKWCTPTLDAEGCLVRLVVQYKAPGHLGRLHVYRRVIGDGFDRVWQSVPAERLADASFSWDAVKIAAETPIEFIAGTWTRNLAESVEEAFAIDGHAIAEGMEDEVEALDMELSQLYRNALYNGEPQMVRTGVDTDKPALPMGEVKREAFSWANSVLPGWMRGESKPATVKAPGKIWDLATGSDAKLLESTGAGAKIIAEAIDRLSRTCVDGLGVVMVDPSVIGAGELSGRALAMLHGPQIDTADNLRAEYGPALVAWVSHFLRLCAGDEARAKGVRLSAWNDALPALTKCWAVDATGARVWNPPKVTLAWGGYFSASWDEIAKAVDSVAKATGGKASVSIRQGVKMLQPLTQVRDVEAELAEIEREEMESAASVHRTLGALSDAPAPSDTADAPTAATGIDPNAVKDQSAALNGAQVQAAQAIAESVAAGKLSRVQGIALLLISFPISRAQAEAVVGDGKTAAGAVESSPFSSPAPAAPTPPAG